MVHVIHKQPPLWRANMVFLVVTLVIACVGVLVPQPSMAQTNERCFQETGFCISGTIRSYWEKNGGLPVFGYPISAQNTEANNDSWIGPTQWFERDRLEDHSAEGKGILAGRLGVMRFAQISGIDWQQLPGDVNGEGGCLFFAETSFNLCEPFLSYWLNSGGLERFGYPITRQRQEAVEGTQRSVQYFERRRMEYHQEFAGTSNAVLLGLLGRDLYAARPAEQPAAGDVPAETQQAILDTAWVYLQPNVQPTPLAIGLVDVAGDYAAVRAKSFGARTNIPLFLKRKSQNWAVIDPSAYTSADSLHRMGVPQKLLDTSEYLAVVVAELEHGHSVIDGGINTYITRPRIAGNYARSELAPGRKGYLDPATAFLKRESAGWRVLLMGTAFREEDLQTLNIPSELWMPSGHVFGPNV